MPASRQARAARITAAVIAVLVLAALAVTDWELGRYGLVSFTFRQAGTGATRNDITPSPSPSPEPVITLVVPQLRDRKFATGVVTVHAGETIVVVP